ncbi:MAG: hypothetical protein KDB62_08405 [Solirubrobacterales bacterium]|jgi:uncharacterized membrane protein|nr:hypothetical protein [Solirubrobacterales bacterium]
MEVILFVHVIAMAFFVGGQIMLAATIVPVERGNPDPARMKAIAQNFGWGSLVALGTLIFTGMLMASHYSLWGNSTLHVKLTLMILTFISLGLHMKYPKAHALMALTFLLTLSVVWFGLELPA